MPAIGVLALQGDVREHLHALEDVGAIAKPVRRLAEIEDLFDRHGMFLPAAFGQPMRRRDLLHVDADHRLAEPA